MASFQSIVEDLLLETGASRAILQLAAPGGGLPSAAEAVTHGARQIRNDVSDDELLEAPAFQELEREKKIVVQDDIERADTPVARALIDRYGARAQVLAPLVHGDRLTGIIAVHHALGPRRWRCSARIA